LRHEVTRVLPYAPEQLFELVGDVERYPEFVPHLKSIRVWDQRSDATGLSALKAEAAVGFAIFQERFATTVRRDRARLTIDVDLLSGPFQHLTNRWRFMPKHAGTEVDFLIDFAFSSRLLNAVLAANFERGVDRIMRAFDERARQLYGPNADRA
jgi:coenzyme Q-binding protein COQ10